MSLLPYHTFPSEDAEQVASKLESLLAELEVYERNVRTLCLDRKLRPYLDFSQKLNFLHQFSRNHADLVSDRMVQLGYDFHYQPEIHPVLTKVGALGPTSDYQETIFGLTRTTEQVLESIRETFEIATSYQDAATMSILSTLAQHMTIALHIFAKDRLAMLN